MPVAHHVEDELDAIHSRASAPKPQTPAQTQELNEPELTWGSKPISLGDGLDRIKPEAGKTIRFALVASSMPKRASTHFSTINGKIGSYLCPGAGCPLCAGGDTPKKSIVALAVQYSNADSESGKLAPDAGASYKIGYLSLGATTFNMLLEAPVEGSQPTDIDYAMSFDGRRYSIRMIAPQARYLKAGDQTKVEAMAAPFQNLLKGKLGRPIPAGAAQAVQSANDYD